MKNFSAKYRNDIKGINIICSIICAGFLLAYVISSPKYIEPQDQYFTFNKTTLLEMLKQGRKTVFTPQAIDFEPAPVTETIEIAWTQKDFLFVSDSFHQIFQGESLKDWKLHFAIFYFDCQQISSGPQRAVFEFFKITSPLLQKSGFEVTTTIDLETNSLWWKRTGLDSNTIYSDSIDLNQLKIPAEVALQIAENNGGKDVRAKAKNDCAVSMGLAPDGSAEDWNVRYFNIESVRLFEIDIDENTGEYYFTDYP